MTSSFALHSWIRLNACSAIGPVRFHKLLRYFSSADLALAASDQEWLNADLKLSLSAISAAKNEMRRFDLDRELAQMAKHQVHLLCWNQEGYPQSLMLMDNPPPLLYVKGDWLEQDRFAIAMVGTRKPSTYGLKSASELSAQLSQAGMTVVSGLAEGIDTAAHQAALDQGGRTIAVMGRGLSSIFPVSNHALAKRIADGGGALLSQFPMDFPGAKWTFPVRNRTIAGLSQGTVVIEGALRSGSMITASDAADLGREVFALPGSITQPQSEGPHYLIQQGARLVSKVEDILDQLSELPLQYEGKRKAPAANKSAYAGKREIDDLTGEEMKVFQILKETGSCGADELAMKSGLAVGKLAGMMTLLELKGAVRSLPGQRYEALLPSAALAV